MFVIRAVLASFILLSCLVNARYVGNGYSFENDWREVLAGIQPRQASGNNGPHCRPLCGSCGSSCSVRSFAQKNSLDFAAANATLLDQHQSGNVTNHLQKRILRRLRAVAVGGYLQLKTNLLVMLRNNPTTNLISIIDSDEGNDYSHGVLREFANYGTDILNIGTAGLEGCTVLTVVSRSAVYMAHFFENLAFSNDFGADPDTAFQQGCLNLITGQGQRYQATGDSIRPDLFTGEDNHAMAFIMTPRQEQADPTPQNPNPPVPGPETQMYEARIAQMTETLGQLIPGITVLAFNYIALNPPTEPTEPALPQHVGKALFEYDPNADGSGNADFRLWYETFLREGRVEGVFN